MISPKKMGTGTNDTGERLRFRKRYTTIADDDLARLAMDEDLVPAAREAITDELEARGLRELSSFKKQFQEDAIVAKADGLSAFIPASARPPPQKDHQLLGLIGLLVFGLVGIHKWLLGDATTWRKEEALAVWLFLGLIVTWDPMVNVLKGQRSGNLVLWLALVSLQFAMPAVVLAVPALGRFVSSFNPLLTVAVLFSPAVVLGIDRAAKLIVRQSR